MSHVGDSSWRCAHSDHFCPPEGCPKLARNAQGEWVEYGCARQNGWTPDQPSPRECQGLLPAADRAFVDATATGDGLEWLMARGQA